MVAAAMDLGLSFLRGMFATVNPCGFILLPTYLVYFLGVEASGPAAPRPGGQHALPDRGGVRRALVVGSAVSAGFIAVFVTVGIFSSFVDNRIEANSKYATVVIGAAFVVLGTAMLAGCRPRFTLPHLDVSVGRSRAVPAMAVYGVAYAIASLGCTMPLFLPSILSGRRDGFWRGVASVAMYGAGMALVVVALTVSLALANQVLLRILRRAMRYVDLLAAAFLVLSGLYLVWYFVVVDVQRETDPITGAVERWGDRVRARLLDHWQLVAAVLVAVVVAATVYAVRRARPDRSGGPAAPDPQARELVGVASRVGDLASDR